MKTVELLCPARNKIMPDQLFTAGCEVVVFDERCIEFLNDISKDLIADAKYGRHPEIVSLSFWLRKSNLLRLKKENAHLFESTVSYTHPLGTVFHVAPSNVDTIFLYSICISLLSGNKNIIRVSSTVNPVVSFIIDIINAVLKKHPLFNEYIKIVSYGHDDEVNKYISSRASCRMIWGGNNTVNHFKAIHPNPYTRDIFFPGKISHAIFNCKQFCAATETEKKETARLFFNDAYLFDQMGCSSPRIIYAWGTAAEKDAFVESFYEELAQQTRSRYSEPTNTLSTLKFNALVNDTLQLDVKRVIRHDNSIYFIEIGTKEQVAIDCGGGYFFIKQINALAEIETDVYDETQTLTYYGLSHEDLQLLHQKFWGRRADRIVPVGQALAFDYIWDGMNLFDELTRKRKIIG